MRRFRACPVIKERCVEQAVRTGLGLNAKINLARSSTGRTTSMPIFRRLSDQPVHQPIVGEGTIDPRSCRGRYAGRHRTPHLEQDAGKSLHDQHPTRPMSI